MTAALEGGEWSAARPGRTLPPGKTRYPFYRRLCGPQGRSGRAENLVSTRIRSRTVQPIVSRYTDWATRPTHSFQSPVTNCKEFIYFFIITHTERFKFTWGRYLVTKKPYIWYPRSLLICEIFGTKLLGIEWTSFLERLWQRVSAEGRRLTHSRLSIYVMWGVGKIQLTRYF